MPKIDKSLYTKEQNKALLAARRKQKELEAIQNELPPVSKLNEHAGKSYAFVLGNGTSRKGLDPAEMQKYGKVYGCNAIYREFDPDYLIAVDVKMILEITKKEYQLKNPNVWTNPNKAYRHINGINFFKPSKGWSSGPTALNMAAEHMAKKIFILGFDYRGLEDGKRVNNVYAGTPNYKKTTDAATYYGNWLKQTATVIKNYPRTTFYRVITEDNFIPHELNKFSNLKHITVEDFKKMFNFS